MWRWLLGPGLAMTLGMAVAAPLPARLPPLDEAGRDASLVAFRDRLLAIVLARDAEALLGMVYSRVENGVRAKNGHDEFRRRWRLDEPDSPLWAELEAILRLGGGFVRSSRGVQFCAPYVFTEFPEQLDIYAHAVVMGERVALKRQPRHGGQTARLLNYHIVQVSDWRSVPDDGGAATAWVKVRTLDGSEGYVRKDKLRSPSDYHACFLAMAPGWRLISLLAAE